MTIRTIRDRYRKGQMSPCGVWNLLFMRFFVSCDNEIQAEAYANLAYRLITGECP